MDCSHFFTHILFHTRPLSPPHFAQFADKTPRSRWTAPISLPISCFTPAPYLCPITQRTVPNHTKNCAQSHKELCPITQRTVPNHSENCAQSLRVLCPITKSTVPNHTEYCKPFTQRTMPIHTENCAQSHRVL